MVVEQLRIATPPAVFVAVNNVKAVAAAGLFACGASSRQVATLFDEIDSLLFYQAVPMCPLYPNHANEKSSVCPNVVATGATTDAGFS